MLYAGVAWSAAGYEVETVDGDGRRMTSPVSFDARRTDELIGHLRGMDHRLVTVVDSTNGILDGRMMAAGLDVYRADPHLLPPRPVFGSVGAGELARTAARRGTASLARLERGRGTQTGREDLLAEWIASAETELAAMTTAGLCLSHGRRDRREVALTFDDGPLPPYTGRILDVLERYGVPATFFCVGMNARAYGEEIVRMREQGHGVANHTWSHPFLPDLTRAQLVEQIDRTGEGIAEAGGGAVPTLFRPPYGSRTPEVMGWLAGTDARTVLWDVAPDDWAMPGADFIATTILDQARPGSVVLLHDGGGDRSQTVDALPAVIEGLLERGFRFVLVDEMVPAAVV
ncbi:polysaccharide deacetylase family protein [Streptomyces sp. SID3212]|uniref:polysaccharide deacetylase family protein n=1 Tax=Streptomyces sp. SID3212 TaxID=2690259 RepID=UPI00136EC6F9|nr:polysaccharide deacetylase family protein [Streptomyces sp. SID3212]MYV53473.1 polysaccharide deacetylase family protein [Streptomyces sp. SID3212]